MLRRASKLSARGVSRLINLPLSPSIVRFMSTHPQPARPVATATRRVCASVTAACVACDHGADMGLPATLGEGEGYS